MPHGRVYRGRGLHVAACILFNRESPRQPLAFVTRKTTVAASRLSADGGGVVRLGNLDVCRDWGWAPDYVDTMVRAIRFEIVGDYGVATAQTRTAEATILVGDAGKTRRELGWQPTVRFEGVVGRMVDDNMELLHRSRQ